MWVLGTQLGSSGGAASTFNCQLFLCVCMLVCKGMHVGVNVCSYMCACICELLGGQVGGTCV